MATKDIKYTLNAQLADNTLTPDDPDDRIFTLVSAGTADKQRVISEIMDVNWARITRISRICAITAPRKP